MARTIWRAYNYNDPKPVETPVYKPLRKSIQDLELTVKQLQEMYKALHGERK